MMKQPKHVLISGAAGQIGYALIPLVATGQVLGPDQPVILHLLDIAPAMSMLAGVVMEINDGAYPLVHDVIATSDYATGFAGVDVAILVGGFPRKQGMVRADLLGKNRPIFVAAGEALEAHASRDVKVLVVANPANTNCLIAATHAPSIPKENFTALTRLDLNRARHQVAAKAGTVAGLVRNLVIWGNHSKTQVPDATFATVVKDGKEHPATELVPQPWLDEDFLRTVQNRGAEVIGARGLSSAMSAANGAMNHLQSWLAGTPPGEHVSMAVWSNGNPYGVQDGLYYSFPVTCSAGTYEIVGGLQPTEKVAALMKATEAELVDERSEAL